MTNGTVVARAKIHPEGPEFSRVIYGTWRIADSPDASTFTPEMIHARIRHCLDLGITTFDLADIYGGGKHQAERVFGAGLALEPALRSRMELVTKCDIRLVCDACPENTVKHYDTSRDYILQCVNDSLAAIGTTFVDVLLLHRPDPLMNADEVAEAFQLLKAQGKVKYFGVSNFSASQMELLQSRLPFPLVTNQLELNPLHLSPLHDGTLDHCQKMRMGVMAWSPMAGGRLFDATCQDESVLRVRAALKKAAKQFPSELTLDQVVLSWLQTLPSNVFAILGTNQIDRIDSAAKASSLKLNRQQWFSIWEASAGREVP